MVDFAQLKEKVGIEDGLDMLALSVIQNGDQYRCPCPACKSGGDRALVITPSKNSYYCFAAKRGGDVIALVAHIKGIGARQAAEELATYFNLTVPESRQQKETPTGQRSPNGDPIAKVREYLVWEHEAVQALGLTPEKASELGIGYKPKGMFARSVVLPIYKDGKLSGYCGFTDGTLKFPTNL